MGPRKPRVATVATATLAVAAMLLVGACGSSGSGSEAPAASAATRVEVAATEYTFDPSAITVPAGSVAFHITNKGNEPHEFEILKGEQVIDEVEGLVPGLDRTLTVDLAAGDYTYVCKLAGHDAAGMKGTLTVTPG